MPLWTLLIGPLVLGVPHVLADIRYLVLDRPRRLSGRQLLAILVPLAAAAMMAAAHPLMLVVPGILAIAGAIAFARVSLRARVAALALLAACAGPLCARSSLTLLWLAHAHNAVAVGLWLALAFQRPNRRPLLLLAVAAVLLGVGVAIGAGAFDFVPRATGGWTRPAEGFTATAVGETLALPGLDPSRSLLLFAYAQAIHYAVWLRLIPGERSASETPVPFRRGLSGLRARLGTPAFAIAIVLALAVPLVGAVAPAETRRLYLELAGFHAWLELAVAAHLGLAWLGPRDPAA
ncbi:MAG TPA: hypothetical protein VF950_30160 [Planctomycetota bacterium]